MSAGNSELRHSYFHGLLSALLRLQRGGSRHAPSDAPVCDHWSARHDCERV